MSEIVDKLRMARSWSGAWKNAAKIYRADLKLTNGGLVYFREAATERFERIEELEDKIDELEFQVGQRSQLNQNLNVKLAEQTDISNARLDEVDGLMDENRRLKAITHRHIKRLQLLDNKWRLFSSALQTIGRMVPKDECNQPIQTFIQAVIDAAENKDYALEKELEGDE